MSGDNLNFFQDEDEEVVLEGSDLYQALVDMGFNDFDSISRLKADDSSKTELSATYKNVHQSITSNFKQKFNYFYSYFCQENKFSNKQLTTILQAKIILDDHATLIHDLFNEQKSTYRILEWFPFAGSLLTASFCSAIISKNKVTITAACVLLGLFSYYKLKHWTAVMDLNQLVKLQNELHELSKKSLKILRRTWVKKSKITEIHEKQELVGNDRWNIIVAIMQLLTEIFSHLSNVYYKCANDILSSMPDFFLPNCILTKVESEKKQSNFINTYDDLKSLYYTFILVQSEIMVILANAYSGKAQNKCCISLRTILFDTLKNLKKALSFYYCKLSKLLENYEKCEIKPVRRVFRGIPNSKWQDTYIHLDLTAHRVQLAYKELTSILEYIDTNLEKNENSTQFVESIAEKMNEAYKHLENARSFAEFSSLLIAKAQRKPIKDNQIQNETEDLFPLTESNKIIMSIDDEVEIEDEVFEEYIKEEYLKPLYESSEGSMENFKIDKLLKKNFMSELKEALTEKQKTMTEREFRALKRMYNKIQEESNISSTKLEKCDFEKQPISSQSPLTSQKTHLPTPYSRESLKEPPPPPPIPPRPLLQTVIAENDVKEDEMEQKTNRLPIPLPRFKTLCPEEEIPEVQRFSIKECTPSFKFPPNFKIAEETFLGSGENSDIEDGNKSDSDEDLVEN